MLGGEAETPFIEIELKPKRNKAEEMRFSFIVEIGFRSRGREIKGMRKESERERMGGGEGRGRKEVKTVGIAQQKIGRAHV